MNHKKIAEAVGVSASTVSKALSGSKEVSEELAEEITKIAIEMGYFKEKSKRKLINNKRTPVLIAVICPEIISVYYSGIINSIKKRVEEKGGQIAVYIYDFDNEKMNNILEMLVVRGNVDGIILFSYYKLNTKPDIPVVILGKAEDTTFADNVVTDEYTTKVINHFKEQGHKKIGYIGEKLTTGRLTALINALKEHGFEINEKYYYVSKRRFEEAGCETAEMFLKAKDRPTAILAAYDEIALGFINRVTREGIRVPEDVSIIGINNVPAAAHSIPALTTVNLYDDERHSAAVDLIFDRIYNEDKPKKTIEIKSELIIRESTARAE